MAASDIMLYWGSGSGPCWRAMIVLHEKGITDYNQKMISFDKKEHKSEEVLKLNPRGQVPTFKIGDIVINESVAICHFLERRYAAQGTKLIPDDAEQMASVLQRMHEVATFQKNTIEELVYYMFRTKPEDRNEETVKTKKKTAADELLRWEAYMEQRGDGSHIASKDFSMADAVFYPQLAFTVRAGLNMSSRLPRLKAYYEMVTKRPSVQATWPPHWKTSEGPGMFSDVF